MISNDSTVDQGRCTKYRTLKLVKGSLQTHLLCKQKLILAVPRVKINMKVVDESRCLVRRRNAINDHVIHTVRISYFFLTCIHAHKLTN